MGATKATVLARLLRQVASDECWTFGGTCDLAGYGRIGSQNGDGEFINGYAHREMYEAVYGPIPGGLVLMHTCDRPACINPRHLKVGTVAENITDRMAKGRNAGPRGSDRLTPEATLVYQRVAQQRRRDRLRSDPETYAAHKERNRLAVRASRARRATSTA